jgi:enoyl-CoA hydratase
MTYAVLAEFHEAVALAGEDGAVHAVVLTGAGSAFCAGTDLSDLAATPEDARSTGGRSGPGRQAEPWPPSSSAELALHGPVTRSYASLGGLRRAAGRAHP